MGNESQEANGGDGNSTKPQMITLRVTAREHYLIKRAAKECGMSVNQWCKEILMNEAGIDFLESKEVV